jgi:hypothetical protein
MAGSGEKLGMDTRIGQPTRWGLCEETFFSGAVALSIAVEDFAKGCHVRGLPTGSVRRVYVDYHLVPLVCCYCSMGYLSDSIHYSSSS